MDLKNIITGTINNIVGKVKDVAENADVKETVKDIYEQGSSKVKAYGQIAKLSLELTGDKEELKKLYTEIGRLYFEETQEPDAFFAPLFEQTREVYSRIQEKEELIAVLKEAEAECCAESDVEVEVCEFEEVVDATEAEGACAEAPVEEAPAAEEAPVEEVKE